MKMNCRVLLTLTLLAIFNYQAAGKLIMKPKNTDAKVNDSTYFNCSSDIGSTSIFWFHGIKYVYIGEAILEPYNERFEIDKNVWNGTYTYNLIIHSVQPGDAGEYICAEDEGFREKYSVQLVVLDDDPICRSNRELDEVIGQNTCNIEPDEVEIECSVKYHGNIPPQMEWKKIGKNSSTPLDVSVVISRDHFVSTLKFKGDIALNSSSFVCETKRATQEPIECTSQVMTLLYALSDNSTVNTTINDEIHCNAITSQSCDYQWKWLQDNDFTIESSTSVLKARKQGWHRCEAACRLRNQTCNLLVMRAMIRGETESSQAGTTIIYVVISVIVTLLVVGAMIFVFRLVRKRKAKSQHEDKNIRDPESNIVNPTHGKSTEHQISRQDGPRDSIDGNSNASPEEYPLLTIEQPDENLNAPAEEHPPLACQASDVIWSNYQFLVENINSRRLIGLLHEKNCITSEERDHLSNQPDDYLKNDALLQWMRTITSNIETLQKVLECFGQDEQNLISDILEKGGVFIKSKISTNLLNERQIYSSLANSSSTNAEELKEEEAMVIEKLNQVQGLRLSSIQSATSEIPDDDIVIAPYCHKEANGIVVWFWCQSENGQMNFKSMYESGILLKKLITIFKEFSSDSVSSVSEILVPNTIFVGDFTKNDTIYGLAVLGQEVFISRLLRPVIEVYDSIAFRLKRRMEVKGMKNPENLVPCFVNKCLYAFDWDYQAQDASDSDNQGQIHAILRIDPTNGNLIKTWFIDGRGGRLSVASDTHVILNINYEAKLHEYTAAGELIRKIDLDPLCTGILRSWHAVKLDNGQFVVCHGGEEDTLSRVCLLSVKSGRTDDVEILNSFGAERGESIDKLMGPTYLSVGKEGSVLVSDASYRTVFLSSNLDDPQIIVSKEHGLRESRTTCFDESTSQWFVAGQKRVVVCRVKDKEVERKFYYLL